FLLVSLAVAARRCFDRQPRRTWAIWCFWRATSQVLSFILTSVSRAKMIRLTVVTPNPILRDPIRRTGRCASRNVALLTNEEEATTLFEKFREGIQREVSG